MKETCIRYRISVDYGLNEDKWEMAIAVIEAMKNQLEIRRVWTNRRDS